MEIILTKAIDCSGHGPSACSNMIRTELEKDGYSLNIDKIKHENNKGQFGHISIHHVKNNHKIFLFYYDKNGIAENVNHSYEKRKPGVQYDQIKILKDGSELGGIKKSLTEPNINVRKATSVPTKAQVISLIDRILTSKGRFKLDIVNTEKLRVNNLKETIK